MRVDAKAEVAGTQSLIATEFILEIKMAEKYEFSTAGAKTQRGTNRRRAHRDANTARRRWIDLCGQAKESRLTDDWAFFIWAEMGDHLRAGVSRRMPIAHILPIPLSVYVNGSREYSTCVSSKSLVMLDNNKSADE